MREITIASVFVLQLLEGAEKQGLNYEPILLRHGISKLALKNQNSEWFKSNERNAATNEFVAQNIRIPLDSFAAVAIEIMRELGDEFLGLTRKPQALGSFNMMCRACISAKSIKRSLRRTANYWNLFWQYLPPPP